MEGHKAIAGMIAAFAWLGSGLYLYLSTQPASLLSSSALAYLVVGMIAAALVFGIAIYWLNRGVATLLEQFVTTPLSSVVAAVTAVTWSLFLVEIIAIVLISRWVFFRLDLGS